MSPLWLALLAPFVQQSSTVVDDSLHFTLHVPTNCRPSPEHSLAMHTSYAWVCESSRSGQPPLKVSVEAFRGEVREATFDSSLQMIRRQYPTAVANSFRWQGRELAGMSVVVNSSVHAVMVDVPLTGRALKISAIGSPEGKEEVEGLTQSFLDGLEGSRSTDNGALSAEQQAGAMFRTLLNLLGLVVIYLVWRWWRARRKGQVLGS